MQTQNVPMTNSLFKDIYVHYLYIRFKYFIFLCQRFRSITIKKTKVQLFNAISLSSTLKIRANLYDVNFRPDTPSISCLTT